MLMPKGHSTITYRLEGVKGCIMEHSQRNVKKRYGGDKKLKATCRHDWPEKNKMHLFVVFARHHWTV